MALQVAIEATPHTEGTWRATLSRHELRSLGEASARVGEKTIVGVISPRWENGTIIFGPSDAIVLNIGTSEDALLVDLGRKSEVAAAGAGARMPDLTITGDDGFRAACVGLLSSEMSAVANELLNRIRDAHPGRLVAGQGRKWVNAPANFFALTIQNRDQSLAVSVRGEPERHRNTPLTLKRDRPGYSRFKVTKSLDMEPALLLILDAARLYDEGRARNPVSRGPAER